jgi:tol-pal system protein YbgF
MVGPGADIDPEAGVPAIPSTPVAVAPFGAPSGALVARAASPVGPRVEDAAGAQYREALRHLSDHRLDDALAGLARFVSEHPDHPYADNALYWRGEIEYAQRDYPRALRSFGDLLRRYPRGNKVPDALLRIGLCYRQMGDSARARRVLDRLRMQYPDSVAARMASQEDA